MTPDEHRTLPENDPRLSPNPSPPAHAPQARAAEADDTAAGDDFVFLYWQ